ncbi:MAG: ISKra4 family transposase, partial [Clostridiales Family XIII bacterium]|nr:ISKra4 family transposase [Clostridiales Family XIII bacterium]
KRGLFVGSGVVESTCKHAIGKRLKQSGMHWSVRGANSIAALRCSIISGGFNGDCDNGVLHRKRLAAA